MFTLYFGFIQFKQIRLSLDLVRGRYDNPKAAHDGEVSHFKLRWPPPCRARWAWATSLAWVLLLPSAGRAPHSG